MSLPLPNLDDRRWADLVEEGRSLIPLYAPGWTDHNIHDPGVMLIELFAWIAEMDIYWLNRIPEQHKRKFLALAGIQPQPPQPARTVLSFTLKQGALPQALPDSLQFAGYSPFGQQVLFRTLEAATLVPGQLQAIQLWDGKQFYDMTGRWQRGEWLSLLGKDPKPGAALYLGFSHMLPQDTQVSLFFTFADATAGQDERARIEQELARRAKLCRSPASLITCTPEPPCTPVTQATQTISHHSVRTAWEYFTDQHEWQRLDPGAKQVEDATRAFTLNGRVLLKIPTAMAKARLGTAEQELYYICCRFLQGTYDAPPRLQDLVLNGVPVEQATATQVVTWSIAPGAIVTGAAPARGDFASLHWRVNDQGEIVELHFVDAAWPKFRVLDLSSSTLSAPGSLSLEAEWLEYGNGRPQQQLVLSDTPVQESSLHLFTSEPDGWHAWQQRPDFGASGQADADFTLDATRGLITFGDGERGRVVPAGAGVIATYRATLAEAGNVRANTITELADTPHNQAILSAQGGVGAHLETITNPLSATGGAPAETVNEATGRALALMEASQRAITAADYETLALTTPGTRLARVAVRPNLHPSFPCFKASGVITVIILPYLPADRPMPSQALRQAVAAYLASRRVIGTRVEVVEPIYLEVAVRARVRACSGIDTAELQQRIVAALDHFFHPLEGGPDNDGWPFGRDVYRSEVLQVIDETPGVDYVFSLELIAEGDEPQCGNICLGPLGLVAAGQHEIEVV